MATESEIENYSTLLSDTKIQGLKNVKQTYIDQISQAKTDLDKATFTDWDDSVSTKFKNHYDTLKTNYSTIATDVGEGSNLDTLITLVSGLKTKCDEYLGYRDEYNSISTGVSFSDEKSQKEYNEYKSGKKKYASLSQDVKNAISNNNSKVKRKKELEGLMSACSKTIDTTLTNIKSITFNASSEATAGIQTEFNVETVPQDSGRLTSEQVIEQYQKSKEKYDELMAKLRAIDYNSDDAEAQIDAILSEASDILREYSDSLLLMYLRGEMSFSDYNNLSNINNMRVIEGDGYGDVYTILFDNSNGPYDALNAWYEQNNKYRTFAERFNNSACSSPEFLQNVPPLSYFYQEGVTIDYNSQEAASQYAAASLVELLENGYTGDITSLPERKKDGDFAWDFNNKAGDSMMWSGFMDSLVDISYQSFDYYHNNGGAFN